MLTVTILYDIYTTINWLCKKLKLLTEVTVTNLACVSGELVHFKIHNSCQKPS